MITITNNSGELVKVISDFEDHLRIGLHRSFGWITEQGAAARSRVRKKHGLRNRREDWALRCEVQISNNGTWTVTPLEGCEVKALDAKHWSIRSGSRNFFFSSAKSEAPLIGIRSKEQSGKKELAMVSVLAAILFFLLLFRSAPLEEVKPVVEEPVLVQLTPPEKAVTLPQNETYQELKQATKVKPVEQSARNVIKSKMGFLDLLGKKDLHKAVGGTPSTIRENSPGAGAGGTQGSGGELLVGLGEGIKKTTVGNSGVAGLGGIGTKGKGGGQGGYGDVQLSSGQGNRISNIALSNDVMIEGGLSQSVIQATIAKYLAQIRACYEEGLRENPGLTGLVGTKFEVGGEGAVNSAEVAQSSLGNKDVEACMIRKMKAWQFPKPLGGVKVRVSYPFLLRQVRS